MDTNPNVRQVMYDDEVLGTGHSYNMFDGDFSFNGSYYTLKKNSDNQITIIRGKDVIGEILIKHKTIKNDRRLSLDCPCFIFKINNREFSVYYFSFNKIDKTYFQFEENGETVGMIQKLSLVVNHLDKYVCYTEDSDMIIYLSLFCLYIQSSLYFLSDEKTKINPSLIFPKKIQKIFDKEYIPKIEWKEVII